MDDDINDDAGPSQHRPNWAGLIATLIGLLAFLAGGAYVLGNFVVQPISPTATTPLTATTVALSTRLNPPANPTQAVPSPAAPSALPSPTRPPQPNPLPSVTAGTPVVAQPTAAFTSDYFLRLINADRAANGVDPVAWDDLAAQVATAHAKEMTEREYLSHWNLAGIGPDVRYGLAGGRDYSLENVHAFWTRFPDGTPGPINLEEQLRAAEKSLMNSPGHRVNILDPIHTHVGVGYSFNPARGELRVAQLFINRYIVLDPLPKALAPGSSVTMAGAVVAGVGGLIIDVAWQPFPSPLSVADIANKPNSYSPDAKSINQFADSVEIVGGRFSHTVKLGEKPGYYHVRLFGNVQGRQRPLASAVIVSR